MYTCTLCLHVYIYTCIYNNTRVGVCVCVCAQLCPTLCDPTGGSPPGFSVHGVFQARILEGVAILYSRESSQPRDQTCISPALRVDSLPLNHLGSPLCWYSLPVLNNLMKGSFSKAYEEDWKSSLATIDFSLYAEVYNVILPERKLTASDWVRN